MRVVAYLVRNCFVLNVLLFAAWLSIAAGLTFPFSRTNLKYALPGIQAKAAQEEEKQPETPAPLPSDFAMIGEMNLYHPERTVPVDKKAEVPRPELVLYGTMVSGEYHLAFVEDRKNPKSTPGRGKRQSAIRKGDVIGGFTVMDIAADRVTLARGEERMTVLLTSPVKQRSTDVPKNQQAQTPEGGGKASAARQPARRQPLPDRASPPPGPRVNELRKN